MPDLDEVAVIMPTLALGMRATLIRRSLDSVLSQEGVRPIPILVVNGSRRDQSLVRHLKTDTRVRVIEVGEAGIPGAFQAGRESVDTQWFSSLDDDDVYLPGALAARVEALRARPDCDTVVTNGLRRNSDGDQLHNPDMSVIEREPLSALTAGNWLLPGSWLCRSERIGPWLFDGMPKFLECTYLAIQFALHCRLCCLDEPTVAWYTDTPESESKSRAYVLSMDNALKRILELPLPAEFRPWIRRKISEAQHNISELHLGDGKIDESWRWHLSSLSGPGGWRHLPFSLQLLRASLRR